MKSNFAASLKTIKKTNNHRTGKSAKIALRDQVLDAVSAEKSIVLDAFAGAGMMYRYVWNRAAGYVGCDLKWYPDQRMAYVADNRRVLRAIDLTPFTIFDLDAYGSPWEHLMILAHRAPPTPEHGWWVCLTVGEGLNIKLGGDAAGVAAIAGSQRCPCRRESCGLCTRRA